MRLLSIVFIATALLDDDHKAMENRSDNVALQ